jgi:AcrR family transcriptional regulator
MESYPKALDVSSGNIRSVTYHHGDLPEAILQAAAAAVLRDGVAAVSLRGLAREVGVSHTAPRHHFGDKRGVITALATQGYRLLAERLGQARLEGTFLDVGVAYVRFALEHPAHYQVMFRPELVDVTEAGHVAALAEVRLALVSSGEVSAGGSAMRARGIDSDAEGVEAGLESVQSGLPVLARTAWSLAHGFATLALADNFAVTGPDRINALAELARETLEPLGRSFL